MIMRFIDKILGRDSEEDTESNTPEPSSVNANGTSVTNRTEIILEHYDVTGIQAKSIAEILDQQVSEKQSGVSVDDIIEDIIDSTGLDQDVASTIARTEYASITMTNRINKYRSQGYGDADYKFIVKDCHEICMDARDEIDDRDGVPLDELQSILRKNAESHPDGTPDRVDHWVPHEKCKGTITRHVPR